jgi:hypothetical protein
MRPSLTGDTMDLIQIIGQVGFPIAVATWLLVKFETKLDATEAAARELAGELRAHTDRCIKCREGKCCKVCDNR